MSTKTTRITVTELCECEGIPDTVVIEMVEYEIARPLTGSSTRDWVFDTTSAHWLRRAIRLRRELEIDWVAVSVLIKLLREKEQLHRENDALRQRLERFLSEE